MYPDVEEAIAQALTLCLRGGVVPAVASAPTALVRDPDDRTAWFVVDDVCPCPTGRRGQLCVHLLAWHIFAVALEHMRQEDRS